jgi:hypothetical protein
MTTAAASTDWSAVWAGALGAAAALAGTGIGILNIGGKRRWDDELLTASSEFLVAVHQAERLAWELRGLPDAQKADRLDELKKIHTTASLLERRVALVGNHKVQRAARLTRRHLYAVIHVEVHQKNDPHPELGKTPRDRLDTETKALVREVRRSLRVKDPDHVFDPDE